MMQFTHNGATIEFQEPDLIRGRKASYDLGEVVAYHEKGIVFSGRNISTGDSVLIKFFNRDYGLESMCEHRVQKALARREHPNVAVASDIIEPKTQLDLWQTSRFQGYLPSEVRGTISEIPGYFASSFRETETRQLFYGQGIVYPHVPGKTLVQLLPQQFNPVETALSLNRLVPIFSAISEGVQHLHNLGFVHADLKPDNVYLPDEGTTYTFDFDITHAVGEPLCKAIGNDTLAIGTPAYMSPEQWQGVEASTAMDIYSLGVLLYEITTGVHPFTGSFKEISIAHLLLPRPFARDVNYAVPAELSAVIQRAMAIRAEDRYARVVDLKEAVIEALFHAEISAAKQEIFGEGRLLGKPSSSKLGEHNSTQGSLGLEGYAAGIEV